MRTKLRGNPTYAKCISEMQSKIAKSVPGTRINPMNMKKINSREVAQPIYMDYCRH